MVPFLVGCGGILEEIERRLAAGEKPQLHSFQRSNS
jgi:hypothetical protein